MGLVFPASFFDAKANVHRPSGFADIPRPFVIRAEHLRDTRLPPAQPFSFTINLFDWHLDRSLIRNALHKMANLGLGPDRVPCSLGEMTWTPRDFHLSAPAPTDTGQMTLEFQTPLELRSKETLPEFPLLITRLRDRISALHTFYADAPLEMDFAHFTDIAQSVRLTSHTLTHRTARRHSTRTGQWHPLNGITGAATYEGPWRSYEDWLRLGEYTGVGKQTAFGKGAFRIAKIEAPGSVWSCSIADCSSESNRNDPEYSTGIAPRRSSSPRTSSLHRTV